MRWKGLGGVFGRSGPQAAILARKTWVCVKLGCLRAGVWTCRGEGTPWGPPAILTFGPPRWANRAEGLRVYLSDATRETYVKLGNLSLG